ncbi:site-specific integrase [Enterobacter hormaechei]
MSRASNGSRRTSSSSPEYLFQSKDGVWIFQIYVPKYMRHLFQNKRAYRKSTGTSDLALARQFRNHMLIEFNNIKTLLNPDQPHVRIQNAIAALPVVRQAPPAVHTPNHTPRTPEPRTDRYSEPETHQSKPEPTLSSILAEYTAQYSTRRAPSTLSKSARAVHVFLSTTKHTDIKICDVTRSLVHRFHTALSCAPQTTQNYLTSLGSLYEFTRRTHDSIPADNPFHGHNLEARASIISYQPFTMPQLQTLLTAAEPELRNIVLLALYSGCRLDELASLRKADVTTQEGVQCLSITKAKTKAGVRLVPVHPTVSSIIQEYLQHSYGDYLFPQANRIKRADGKRGPWYSQTFTRLKRKVLPASTDRQCFHSLRGMFITCLDRAGVPEQRIGLITGHTELAARTEAFRTYSQGAEIQELAEYVSLVCYDDLL